MYEINLRPADLCDLPYLVRHRREMFREMGHADEALLQQMSDASEQFFRSAIPAGRYVCWLAEAAGRVVAGGGLVLVDWPGSPDFPAARRGWILNIYTEPEFRRHGIARRIMDTILDWCRAQGFAYVSLHASPAGRPLYDAMSFHPTNEMRLYLK